MKIKKILSLSFILIMSTQFAFANYAFYKKVANTCKFYRVSVDEKKMSLVKNSDGSYEKSFRFFPSFKTIFGIVRAINGKQLRKNIIRKNNILFPDWVSGAVVLISINLYQKLDKK